MLFYLQTTLKKESRVNYQRKNTNRLVFVDFRRSHAQTSISNKEISHFTILIHCVVLKIICYQIHFPVLPLFLRFLLDFVALCCQLAETGAVQIVSNRQYNKNIIKLSMSACHFPQDNYTIILDVPSISHINQQLRLIETSNHLPAPSFISLAFLDKPNQITQDLLRDEQDQDSLGLAMQERDDQEDQVVKKKKTGCTCKKTNCLKMYCQCFSVGKMCTEDCACYGCHNHSQCQSLVEKAKLIKAKSSSNRHNSRGCNCKKTNCQKKYCECYNAGLVCTQACNCSDCCNKEKEEKCGQHSADQNGVST